MGLALTIGILADLKENDAEGLQFFSLCFSEVNKLLLANKLPAHVEPEDIAGWDAEMFGYSGLHYLRRLAAYVDSDAGLPGPGDDNSSNDERLQAYFSDVIGNQPGMLKSLFRKRLWFRREFDHLIVHSDAEGFYLPQDFPNVLLADDKLIPSGMVGSTARLRVECERLARVLDIPSSITKDSDELWEAADSQGEGESTWQQYGVESFTCVALLEACSISMERGAAIVFT